jgi:ABC-2 type transport system ATP-binding protein
VAAVEVTSLAKRFPGVVAVADVSFTAAAGELTAILGRNGAGKTTTVDICAGLQRADGGSVRIMGLDPQRDAVQLHSRLGVMPQGGSTRGGVYPSARVGETLRLFAALYARPLPVNDLLERLDLQRVARTPWRRLSGGEQQRLSLALSVVGRPEVVFLDEPTAGLDVQGRRSTWRLIEELKAAGVTVVLTTHLIDEAESLADQVVIVDRGRVIRTGSPRELVAATDRPELRFEGPAGLPVDDLEAALPAGSTAVETTPGHYLVAGTVTPETVAAVTAWCARRGALPDRITTGAASLEEVFVRLTGSIEPDRST